MLAASLFRLGRFSLPSQYYLSRMLANVPAADGHHLQSTFSNLKLDIPEQGIYNTELQNASNLDQLLRAAEITHLNGKEVIFIFNNLRKWTATGKIKTEDFIDDSRFWSMCQILQKECYSITNNSLISALYNVLELGLPSDSMIVRFLENEVLWKAKKMSLATLITCLSFHKYYQETHLQKSVVTELIKNIEQRQYEMNSGFYIIKLFQEADLFSKEFLEKVEKEALACISSMSGDQLHQLLITLSQKNRRPISLLQRISNYMNGKTDRFTVKQLIDTLFALNTLCFPESGLIQKLCDGLITKIPNITKPQSVSTLLISLGKLSWRSKSLLEACSDWIIKNVNICRPKDFASYILTLAKVNYHPEELSKILLELSPHLVEKQFDVKKVWLDVVWSLAILREAKEEHLLSVLKPSFYEELIENGGGQSNIIKLKLLNVRATAIIQYPMNPFFSNVSETLLNAEIQRSNSAKLLTKSVIDAMTDIIPLGKFMVTDKNSKMGFSINAEFIVDKKGKPFPIEKYGVRSGLSNICKPLPPDTYRIAVFVWDYKDFTVNAPVLLGVNALAVQLMKKLGYTTVEVPYTEYSDKLTPVKKVQYLQFKIKEAIESTSVPNL